MPGADAAIYGEGLARVLDAVAARMPCSEVEEVWAFPGVRREGREYGVAVVTRRTAGAPKLLVYRARYTLQLKGQDRGKIAVAVDETADAPDELVPRVIDGVRRRADEAGEAERVDLGPWKAGRGGERGS